MRTEQDATRALSLYADTVRRICFMHLKNYSDVEDVFQDVFMRYILHDASFQSDEHEKAWIIRVSINRCRDILRSFFRSRVTSLQQAERLPALDEQDRHVWQAVFALPDKYRDVIYLHYYEGYTAVEIADILNRKPNTIYTWLARAKDILRQQLGGEPLG